MGKTKNKSETDENNSSDHGCDCDQGAPPQENQNTQEVEANDVHNLSENRKDLTSGATSTTTIIISEDETQKGEVAAEAHEGALGSGYNNGNGTGLSNSHFPGNDNKGDKVDSCDSFISSTKIHLVNPPKPEKIIVNGGNDTQRIATTKTTEIGPAGPGEHSYTNTESKSVIISLSEDPPPPPSRKCECECQRTDNNFLEANKIKNHLSHLGRRHSYSSYGKKKGAINFGYVPNEADVAELEFQRQLLHQLQLQFQLQTGGGGQVSDSDLKPTPASVAVTAPLSRVVEITPEMGLPKSKFTQNPCTTVDDSGRESNCSHSANSSINELTLRSRDPDHGHNHHDDHECSEEELEEDNHHHLDDDHHHHRLRSSLHSNDTHRHMDRMVSMRKEFVRENARRCLMKSIRFRFTETDSERIREDVFVKICSNGELLGKLFCLFDFEQTNVLQQDEWIEFLKARLNGEEKQIDFVEVVESVTYALCRDSDVNFEQFCAIFRTKNVLNKFFRLIDRDLDGIVTADQVMEFISQLSSARSNSRLTKENIKWLERLFRQYVGEGNEIRKEDFNKIIQTKNQFFTERVFEIFDRDSSGSISLQEFLDCMHQFTGQNPDDKIHFLFKVYDVDGDGLIQEAELEQVMTACMEENGMKFSDEQIHELTIALFEDADVEKRGALTYEALKAQLEKHTGLLENLSISIERWLVPPKPRETDQSLLAKIRSWKPHQLSPRYFRNNYVYLLWLFAFLITNAALFFYRIFNWRYRDGTYDDESTHYLVVARAAGQCLNFDCTFIVVVMLRQTLTFLRARGASTFLPIDQHIYFHKMTGWFIFVFSLLHTVAHLVNISEGIIANSANTTLEGVSYIAILFDPNATNLGLIHGYGFNTGFFLMIILTVMVICSLPFVRRGGCFEVFYWTHTLYLLFWILLIVHAPNFWKWFVVPGVIFIVEQALRYYHWRVGRGRTYILSGILLPSKVTHISIRRPSNFEFRPGDYVFVRIPQIATYEWHPFTISSAPEQDGMISLHIRAVGQWTNRLYEYFDQEQMKLRAGTGEEMCLSPKAQSFTPTIRIGDKLALLNSSDINAAGVPNNTVQLNSLPTVTSTYSEPPENLVKRVAFQDHANRLKSVGDSVSTMMPSSSESDSLNNSNNDITSSAEAMSDLEAIVKSKKVPIRLHKPKLESTKSMPNVHERMVDRERKLIVRHNPVVQRSISVQSVENDSNKSGSNLSYANGSSNPVVPTSRTKMSADSLRYMRNRPTVISLKTPEFNYDVDDDGDNSHILGLPIGVGLGAASGGNNNADRLAEEGISPLGAVHVDDITDVNNSVVVTSAQKKAVQRQWSSFQIMGTTDDDMVVGRPLEIYVDGPYGAPSSHIFRAQHAVLIATGIGVTPFASILQSIMLRYWASRLTCPNCNFTWCGDMPQSVFNLKKVDFLWINREQRSFEWFVHLLSQLEIEQAELGGAMERFLDMHMYITSALQRTDMKAVGLQLALDLLHEKEKRDLITGLKTRTNAGRPNWNKLFKQLQDQNKGKITVFYCGPPALARTLKVKCDEFGFSFRKELF